MSEIIRFAEHWTTVFSIHLLEISLFILLVWGIDATLKLGTRVRYSLWLLALIKVFIPPVVTLPGSFPAVVSEQVFWFPGEVTVGSGTMATGVIPISLSLFGTWIIWMAVLTALIFVKSREVRKRIRSAERVADFDKHKFANLGIQDLDIFQSERIESPVVVGFLRLRLYLPVDWPSWTRTELTSILAHETAHISNWDLRVLFLQNLAILLFGMNPLVWLVVTRLNLLRELRCDEFAIEQTGINPVQYSKLICSFIERQLKTQSQAVVVGKYFAQKKTCSFMRINHLLSLKEATMRKRSLLNFVLPVLGALLLMPFSWKCNQDLGQAPLTSDQAEQLTVAGEVVEFQPYDQPPTPLGGFQAIQRELRYPRIARKAGIEGRVIVQVLITEEGKVEETKVIKSLGKSGCDEAAQQAVRGVKWKPAIYENKPVKVRVAIPIVFKLS